MTSIIDVYKNLFGKKGINDGDVISMSEHGRQGGISTNQGLKFVENIAIAFRVDPASSTVTYLGKAAPGTATSTAAWQISKVDTTSGTVITWADSDDNYDNVWDDRASLSYS